MRKAPLVGRYIKAGHMAAWGPHGKGQLKVSPTGCLKYCYFKKKTNDLIKKFNLIGNLCCFFLLGL